MNKELLHTSHPVYLGVTLDRTLSYKQHIMKVKGKTAARNNIIKKLSNTKWGTSPSTIKTTALALSYSTAEYACPVWERSTHAEKIDPVLNEACRLITGSLKPTKVESLYQLTGNCASHNKKEHHPPKSVREKQTTDNRHSLYGHRAPTKRLKSRKSFVHSVQPITLHPLREQIICMDQPPTVYTTHS